MSDEQHNAPSGKRGAGGRHEQISQSQHSTSARIAADTALANAIASVNKGNLSRAAIHDWLSSALERLIGPESSLLTRTDARDYLLRFSDATAAQKVAQNGAHPNPTPDASTSDAAPALLGVSLADVEVEDIDWLWHGRIALRKITLLDAEPGQGKSLVTLDLASRVAMRARMPDGSEGLDAPAGVVIVCAEDGLADTVKPRMLAAGTSPATLRHVRAIDLVPEKLESGQISQRLLSLVNDLASLEATIKAIKAKLLIIDPITAYLGSQVDMYKDSDVRAVLTPLALMAQRAGVAVVLVRHLTKDEEKSALNRGLGSIAFIGVARFGLLVTPNPNDKDERLLGRYKGNIGAQPPTWAYKIRQVGESENSVKVDWLGERAVDIKDALTQQGERFSVVTDAARFLREELKDGDVSAKDIFSHAEEAGFSRSAINRAKERLGIDPKKVTKDGETHWMWTHIPADDTRE